MRRGAVLGLIVLAATTGAAGIALSAPATIGERFEAPPLRSRAGDLHFQDFIFWRARNPNGRALPRHRDQGRNGMLRLRVKPGPLASNRRDPSERAELREHPARQLPYGTAVWYRFALRVPDAVFATRQRLVLAQLKSPATHMSDPSPVFALRVMDGKLAATIEFERDPDDEETIRPRPVPGICENGWVPAYLHRAGQVRVVVAGPVPAHYRHCTRGVTLGDTATIPDIANRWSDIHVAIRPGPDGYGRLVLTIDGVTVAQARGRIGHRMEAGRQFFKIGPYRDPGDKEIAIDIDDIRRGEAPAVLGGR